MEPTPTEIAALMRTYPPPTGRSWDDHAHILTLATGIAEDMHRRWCDKRVWWGYFELGGWIGGLIVLYQWLQTH